MQCNIEWNNLSVEEWNQYLSKIRRAPLLQSYNYSKVSRVLNGRIPSWGTIILDGKPEGVFQLETSKLPFGLYEAIILDMGPLWFNNNCIEEKYKVFFKHLNMLFPRKFNRKRRIIPNLEDKPEFQNIPAPDQYIKKPGSYETIWLDLTQDEEALRTKLKQKWRNSLNKSERCNLLFEVDRKAHTLDVFKQLYQIDQIEKKYKNIPPRHLDTYQRYFLQDQSMFIFYAKNKHTVLASALILMNNSSATYQIGVLNKEGREYCANHFLLWNIILFLKEIGIKDFDLGGINAYDAKSIKYFKEGLNGQQITYKGIYS